MKRFLSCAFLALTLAQGAHAAPAKKSTPAGKTASGKSASKTAAKGVAAIPWGTALALTASDGVATKATWGTAAQATRGVVLIHDARTNNTGWRRTAEGMLTEGWAVIAVDLRGHGTSAFQPARALQMVDYQDGAKDVAAAVAHLRTLGIKQVALAGVGLGATLALTVAADDPAVSSVIAISPGLNLQGMPLEPLVTRYGARPLLLVSANEDANGTAGATAARTAATGLKEHRVLNAPRGTLSDFHQADPSFARSLSQFVQLGWTNPSAPAAPPVQKRVEVRTEGSEAVGKAFGQ